jgi:acetoin utilization deacetylase AcuC-like enzyme
LIWHEFRRSLAAPAGVVDWMRTTEKDAAHFFTDPEFLKISIDQDSAFPPGSGSIRNVGGGAWTGYNLNLPLPTGSGVGAYPGAFERVIVPVLR